MKKFFAILIVAILATSFAFSQTGAGTSGTGTANVTVILADMYLNPLTIEATLDVYPNTTSAEYSFAWQFGGSAGLGWVITPTGWSTMPTGISIVGGTPSALTGVFPTGNPGDITTLSGFTYAFKVACAAGTGAGSHTLTYGWSVAYN